MKVYEFYTAKEIKPCGWIKRQLEIQAEGLAGKLDKVWRDVRDSKWIGGKAEGWERVPYWLDGFIPLAYLLENEDMISRAKKYIDAIIASQQADGWICPCSKAKRSVYDTWAVELISKVLCVYYECCGDDSVLDVIYKILKNYYDLLSDGKIKLFNWGRYRWFECFIAINLVYEKYNEPWLAELARILKKQGKDYNGLLDKWKKPNNVWTFHTHIVNITMALKSEAVSHNILGEEYRDNAQKFYDVLYKYNGTPVGLFTGDECLSGISPIQGTELCSVVEQMYSYELLYAYTGDKKWAEKLELLAFNALPASVSDDMWAHQYVQMSNQIACQRMLIPVFRTNNGEAHLFGLEPHFGCCTANFGQGFPKFVLSAFMHNSDTIVNAVPIPSELKTEDIHIVVDTLYPFKNHIKYTIESKVPFTFKIRIPSFAENLRVNGNPFDGDEYVIRINSSDSIAIDVCFDTVAHFEKSQSGLTYAKCGSLVYSLPIEYKKVIREYTRRGIRRKYPYCDYEYVPQSDWNYAYCDTELIKNENEIGEFPFSSQQPPVTLTAWVKKIDWGFERGHKTVCAKVPKLTAALSEKQKITLYPYACSKLRVTELSMIK